MECLCEGASCGSGSWCLGQQCFTSLALLNGTSVLQKGCIASSEEDSTRCQRPPTPELVVECCLGNLCNMNASLQLPVEGAVWVFWRSFFLRRKIKMIVMHKHMQECWFELKFDRRLCSLSSLPTAWSRPKPIAGSNWIFMSRTCFFLYREAKRCNTCMYEPQSD